MFELTFIQSWHIPNILDDLNMHTYKLIIWSHLFETILLQAITYY